MRVIAGIYRRRRLEGPDGLSARPTSDRLRETVFNILQPVIEGARFLDLCAGSGAVGIEALSRGADHATFVDSSRVMSALQQRNLGQCQIDSRDLAVRTADALHFLETANDAVWDLIYFDPPYQSDHLPVLDFLGGAGGSRLAEDGQLLFEHSSAKPLPEQVGHLRQTRVVKQGDSMVTVYRRTEPGDSGI